MKLVDAKPIQFAKFLLAVACLILAAVCSIAAVRARTLLLCHGFSVSLKGPISHYVGIDGNTAEFDGKHYHVSESATEFVLTGPVPVNDTIVHISRLTGEWYLDSSPERADKMEYSASGEDGCRKATQKF
ncbi:hypothetical protein [Bradyrhizobium sp. SZCCHNR1045]|uniref:hypothetical protein n=1 Tax=Bradyrhizobium sp. SZCCHNR1045 TaxID=3057353 RepID=UPI002916D72F|nr:hypothetical protein [Bradyrhizobium sp. SZCCHNR1045]